MTKDRRDHDLDALLGGAEPPAPSDAAREKAMTAAMSAFDAVQEAKEEQAKAALHQGADEKTFADIQASEPQPRQRSREQRGRRGWSGLFKRRPGTRDPAEESRPMRTYSYRNRYAIALTVLVAAALPSLISGQVIPGIDNSSWMGRDEVASTGGVTGIYRNGPSTSGQLSSPVYESKISEFSEQEARQALERGRAFQPVLQGQLPIDNNIAQPLPPAVAAGSAAASVQALPRAPSLNAPMSDAADFDTAQLNRSGLVGDLPYNSVVPVPTRPEIIGGRDRFEAAPVNPFQQTKQEPVSTFSIDVDTASYSFVRRTLRGGQLPPPEAVRIEEMVNYFDYNYSTPSDPATPFEPTVAVYPSPWNQGTQILHVGIKGYEVPVAEKPRSNLTFLIDTSGSMTSADKLPLLQQSLRMMVEQLNPDDTVAIVAYAGNAGTVLEPTPISERSQILRAIDRLAAGGSTAGGEGIRLAYKLARQNFDDDAVNQVIIGTDGDFNVGITDPNALQDYIEAERASGVFLSVLGFGQGNYNDALMQRLAQNGNGFAAYIDTADEARKVLVEELTSTLVPIAKDVKIQIEFNPNQVSEYRLVGYESRMLAREDFDDDRVDAGEIGAGHTVTALYEIVPVGALVAERGQQESLRYADAYSTANILQQRAEPEPAELSEVLSGELGFLKLRYKLPNEDTSRLITRPIQSDEAQSIENTSQDVQFAAAVAGFAQLLRRSSAVERGFDYADVERLVRRSEGADRSGRRAEFLSLVQRAAELSNQGRYR